MPESDEHVFEIRSRTITIISTALALVAGLFLQNAVSDTIKVFVPITGAWAYEIVVALCVVIVVAIVIYLLNKTNEKKD